MKSQWLMVLTTAAVLTAGCSMKVDDKSAGEKKNVDIQTPMGDLKVRTDQVEAKDTGLPVYAGATELKDKNEHSDKANVNINTPWFGLKVVALKYASQDSPDKVVEFYKDKMKKFGEVTECQGDIDVQHDKGQGKIRCKPNSNNERSLAVGEEKQFRVVSVKPRQNGSEFSIAYVNMRGEQEAN